MKIHTLHTGFFKLDGGAMFGVVPKKIWNKLNAADDNNLCTWAMKCLLVEDDGKLILIDCGIGNKQDEKFFGHYHLSEIKTIESLLSQIGYKVEDITDVFLTHLHFDHCGGAVNYEKGNLATAFPNAIYWTNERHWKWATQPNDREKASFLEENINPIQESGRLKFIEVNDGVAFTKNMVVRFAYGHTDAMMLPQIRYKDRIIVYMADLLPSTAHIPIPYVMAYDMFPLITLEEKKSFLQEAFDNNYVLFFEHDPVNECCELQMTDKGLRAGRTFKISDM
jgi:glyoxylase-like metal-dependent hydrolase (beta-lactamase superfamily II)